MLRRSALAVGLLALIGLCTPASARPPVIYDVFLSGPNESPPNASPGIGFFEITADSTAHTMRVNGSFSGLTGTTSASHIHAATAAPLTGTANVATQTPTFSGFPLGVTAGAYDQTFNMTLAASYNSSYITANGGTPATAELALFQSFADGKAYLNIHSSTFPGGEIRGFLVPVPEPATFGILALSSGCVMLTRRRQRR